MPAAKAKVAAELAGNPAADFVTAATAFAETVQGVLLDHPYAMANSTGQRLAKAVAGMKAAAEALAPADASETVEEA